MPASDRTWAWESGSITYFRTAVGAYYAALAGLVTTSVHWRELPEHRGDATIGMRFSWV